MKTNINSLLPTIVDFQSMKSNFKLALILTPAIFLFAFWIMTLSSSDMLEVVGLPKMLFWALVLSFGSAYSITMFVIEILKQSEK